MTKTLTWTSIRAIGKQDGAGRWTPSAEVAEYFRNIRTPSRAWPNSMAKAAQTAKFANWLATNRPEIAAKLLAN
jgi:hypothetical protein